MNLNETAKKILSKGILAMDESSGTMKKRLEGVNVDDSHENRQGYRSMLITTPDIGNFISGAILFDETIRDKVAGKEETFPQVLEKQGVVPGIKVDMGKDDLPFFPNEKVTEGLDGLRERLKEYFKLGAKFAKWRSVIVIGEDTPTQQGIDSNAHGLARYAAMCQDENLVPIVEPEVLMDGTHDIDACYEATDKTLKSVFAELKKYKVDPNGMILKPNMVISGKECPEQASAEEIAEKTVKCFKENLPDSLPGVAFLSGGMSDKAAAENLNAMNSKFGDEVPWRLTYSYGRALQREALSTWADTKDNEKAQKALIKKAETYYKASKGQL